MDMWRIGVGSALVWGFCLDRASGRQTLCRQTPPLGNMIVPSGSLLVGRGALPSLTATATQAVTAGHGARRGGDSDQHGKPWPE